MSILFYYCYYLIVFLPIFYSAIWNNYQVKTKPNKRFSKSSQIFGSADKWGEFRDVIPNFSETSLKANSLLEHMNTTKDQSDYLWYSFRYLMSLELITFPICMSMHWQNIISFVFIYSYQQSSNCTKPLLHAESLGHVLHAFINDIYIGNLSFSDFHIRKDINFIIIESVASRKEIQKQLNICYITL